MKLVSIKMIDYGVKVLIIRFDFVDFLRKKRIKNYINLKVL